MLNLFQKQDIFDENERTFYYIRNIAVLYFFLYLVVFGTMLFPHFSEGILCGREEIQDCYFIKYRADTNLWSKIYKTYLLKLAHSKMENFYFLFCNDTYADYYIAYYAKTMYFISTEPLYILNVK